MAAYFYGIGKKPSKVELPLQSPPPITLPVPLPSSPKEQLRETAAETECETFSSLAQEDDLECDAPLSPNTADVLYNLSPQDLQLDLEKVQEGYSVRSRTGSSPLFSSAANSPSPSVIMEESCDDITDLPVPSTPAISSTSSSSPSVTVVATASTTGVLPAAAISALNRYPQGQGAASRRSNVWKYFQTLEGGFFAKCKLCGKQVSRGKKLGHLTNAGMNLHLKNYHHSTLLRAEAEKEDGSAGSSITDCTGGTSSSTPLTQSTGGNREGSINTTRPRAVVPLQTQSGSSSSQGHHQPTLDSFVGFSSKGMSKQQANKITRLIGQFIAVGGASFCMIEGEPFKQLMHAQYVVPA